MPTIDNIPVVVGGDPILAAHFNLLGQMAGRVASGPGMLFESTGIHRRRFHADFGAEWYYGKLNESLTGGAGNKASVSVWNPLNESMTDWEDANWDLDECYAPPLMPTDETLTSGWWVEVTYNRENGLYWVTNAACDGPA